MPSITESLVEREEWRYDHVRERLPIFLISTRRKGFFMKYGYNPFNPCDYLRKERFVISIFLKGFETIKSFLTNIKCSLELKNVRFYIKYNYGFH